MSGSRRKPIALPAPYLRRLWLDETQHFRALTRYPFCLPIFAKGFDLSFDSAITIIVGENGTGKSTILEGIAALAGYDDAGGGKGYMPLDHTGAVERAGGLLAKGLRASWLPKITNGWFFKAESFFSSRATSIARRLMPRAPAGLSFAFPRRRLFAFLRGALRSPGTLHFR